ncbi:MAG: FMN-binding negative transcriptional regulator [Motiliproteus sp.]
MHIPKRFQQNDTVQLEGLIRDYPFATLVTQSQSGIDAHHLPVILTERQDNKILQAHIAKTNPIWKTTQDNCEVLVIFNGPNCYISPNHYPTKIETGKAVPTWNYVTVHVKGVISFTHDEDWLLAMVENLTAQHESSQATPWSTSDAPKGYIQKMLAAIVGLEIEITAITGQWKLSQNQPEKNRLGVVAGLSSETETETESQYRKVAELVKAQMGETAE